LPGIFGLGDGWVFDHPRCGQFLLISVCDRVRAYER